MPYFPATGLQLLRYYELTAFSFKWRPSAIVDFIKFEILTAGPVWRANMHHQAKFRADLSNRSGDMAVFQFFKITASAILDLFYIYLDIHKEYLLVFATVQNLVGIDAVVSIICQF